MRSPSPVRRILLVCGVALVAAQFAPRVPAQGHTLPRE